MHLFTLFLSLCFVSRRFSAVDGPTPHEASRAWDVPPNKKHKPSLCSAFPQSCMPARSASDPHATHLDLKLEIKFPSFLPVAVPPAGLQVVSRARGASSLSSVDRRIAQAQKGHEAKARQTPTQRHRPAGPLNFEIKGGDSRNHDCDGGGWRGFR